MSPAGFSDRPDIQDGQVNHCMAARDGECSHRADRYCPQLREGEPGKTGRHCPLDRGCPRCGYETNDCMC